jgi:hypothetical protein
MPGNATAPAGVANGQNLATQVGVADQQQHVVILAQDKLTDQEEFAIISQNFI